jgi:acyl-CoA reductase-like NAD-dependent aldehyde dehydrogenase
MLLIVGSSVWHHQIYTISKEDPMPRTISQFINGQSVTHIGAVTSPVYDPSTGQVQARLEHGDAAILAEVVAVAKAAQPAWAAINPQRRARVMFKFKALIEEHRQELVHLMSSEHGKLLDDSKSSRTSSPGPLAPPASGACPCR